MSTKKETRDTIRSSLIQFVHSEVEYIRLLADIIRFEMIMGDRVHDNATKVKLPSTNAVFKSCDVDFDETQDDVFI